MLMVADFLTYAKCSKTKPVQKKRLRRRCFHFDIILHHLVSCLINGKLCELLKYETIAELDTYFVILNSWY